MSVWTSLYRFVSHGGNARRVKKAAGQIMAGSAGRVQLQSVAASDTVMMDAGAWAAGADNAVAAADLAAQRMGDLVTGGACIAGYDIAVMTQFFTHGALLGLGQRAQREQYSTYTENFFHDFSSWVIVAGAMPVLLLEAPGWQSPP
jgi:hypothetical protein